MLEAALLLFAVALAGAALPLLIARSQALVHGLVAFSTGLFLGVLGTHLLPEVARAGDGAGPWIAAAAGVVVLLAIDRLLVRRATGDVHTALGWSSAIGLSVHAAAAGLGLAAARGQTKAFDALVVSIAGHKAAETFSLSSVLLLAGAGKARALGIAAAFALVTPAALLGGGAALSRMDGGTSVLLSAFAAGTFVYVALGDLLPEVFHHRGGLRARLMLLLLGAAAGLLPHLLEG